MAESLKEIVDTAVQKVHHAMGQFVDAEIERLNNAADFEDLRKERIKKMKEEAKQQKQWALRGHGRYEFLSSEQEFFDVCKKSERVVCHFFMPCIALCKIVDSYLKKLSRQHMETKFVSMNAEKSPFLSTKLNISIIPLIVLIKNNKILDTVQVFSFGDYKTFTVDALEVRLAKCGVVNSDLDPEEIKRLQRQKVQKQCNILRSIRSSSVCDLHDDSSSN